MKKGYQRFVQLFKIKTSLWRGALLALPIGIIGYIIYAVYRFMNNSGEGTLSLFTNSYIYPGLGFLLILFFIFILGRLEIYFENKKKSIWQFLKEKTVGKVPLIGSFFTNKGGVAISWDDIKKSTPCKFWLSDTTPHYGFILGEQPIRGGEPELDIYRPNVPTLLPGDLFPVKKRYVIKLGNPAEEIIKKLASGGLLRPEEEIPVPWDDETEEEFRERITLTPLEIAVKKILEQLKQKNNQSTG